MMSIMRHIQEISNGIHIIEPTSLFNLRICSKVIVEKYCLKVYHPLVGDKFLILCLIIIIYFPINQLCIFIDLKFLYLPLDNNSKPNDQALYYAMLFVQGKAILYDFGTQ